MSPHLIFIPTPPPNHDMRTHVQKISATDIHPRLIFFLEEEEKEEMGFKPTFGQVWGFKTHCKQMYAAAAAAANSPQLCPTLCDPIDGSPPGSPVLGILQARTLEWVAISFSNAWKRKVKGKSLSRVRLLATPWTTAYQSLPSMGFSR